MVLLGRENTGKIEKKKDNYQSVSYEHASFIGGQRGPAGAWTK